MKKVLIALVSGCLLFLIIIFGTKLYYSAKMDGATEAANVFTSPSHQTLFNEHFVPYPKAGANKCYDLIDKFRKCSELQLIDYDWGGVYVFEAKPNENESLLLILYENDDGMWGVECVES